MIRTWRKLITNYRIRSVSTPNNWNKKRPKYYSWPARLISSPILKRRFQNKTFPLRNRYSLKSRITHSPIPGFSRWEKTWARYSTSWLRASNKSICSTTKSGTGNKNCSKCPISYTIWTKSLKWRKSRWDKSFKSLTLTGKTNTNKLYKTTK